MTKFFRIQGGSWVDDQKGAQKVQEKADLGWTIVNMFNRDFDRHQEYLAKFRDIYDWVLANVGVGDVDWLCANECWCFKDANKAMLFKLTWGGA